MACGWRRELRGKRECGSHQTGQSRVDIIIKGYGKEGGGTDPSDGNLTGPTQHQKQSLVSPRVRQEWLIRNKWCLSQTSKKEER